MSLTVVMYHYVRRIAESRYPEIKGLERHLFVEQIAYLKQHYHCVTAQEVVHAWRGDHVLPKNAMLLTFDDGYLDHYLNVLPILQKEKLHGCFYPPVKCVWDRVILDVNKIHFVLASVEDKSRIVASIEKSVDAARAEFGLEPTAFYRGKYAVASRYDTAEVIYIKRMLQVALPEALRNRIVDELFRHYVSIDEKAFASEVYMDQDQLRCLVEAGMTVGSHGYSHCWMNSIDRATQEQEIDHSLSLLEQIGVPRKDWTMCYPYGAWNESLLDVLRERGCGLGVTTEVDLASVEKHDPLLLPRLDTNDLPKAANAEMSPWTARVLA
jgi:peptidoglycan/xylan/chitin deacetylase (PgdA/CDA1 family)